MKYTAVYDQVEYVYNIKTFEPIYEFCKSTGNALLIKPIHMYCISKSKIDFICPAPLRFSFVVQCHTFTYLSNFASMVVDIGFSFVYLQSSPAKQASTDGLSSLSITHLI